MTLSFLLCCHDTASQGELVLSSTRGHTYLVWRPLECGWVSKKEVGKYIGSSPVNTGKPSKAPERKGIREEGGQDLGNLFCEV